MIEGRNSSSCPCGGVFCVTYEPDSTRPIGLAHSTPPCERFVALEVTDFLVYVRETAAKRN